MEICLYILLKIVLGIILFTHFYIPYLNEISFRGGGCNSPPLEINEDIELSKNLFTHTNLVD